MSDKTNDISELLRQVSEGSELSFEILYKRYFKKSFAIALYYVQSESYAEDVLSEVFLGLWSKRASLWKVKDWESYLFVTVKHHALNFLEKNKSSFLTYTADFSIELPDEISQTPEELLLRSEVEEAMRQAVDSLPMKTKIVYYMAKEEHMSYKAISEALNISERTVNSHLTAAVRKLTQSLRLFFKK
ncbi:RNA polymerase sigma-70 factor [Bacteroidales bacterium SW299]|nr:RNA polymerase sigma-70 factor [Bacteroidales bacterium SW299]